MSLQAWLAVVSAAAAAFLLVPGRPRLPRGPAAAVPPAPGPGGLRRHRLLLALLAGAGGALFVGGRAGPVAGLAVAVAAWVVAGRAEPADVRRRRALVRRDLPHLVSLLASALRSGTAPGDALRLVCAALPGPATERLDRVAARLALGVDPVEVWGSLADDPELAPLGRALARAQATGASVVRSVERLADELGERARGDVEERARAVGVKAAVPLGLCLLPAFVLIGIVPLVAALLTSLDL
ncbi:type II secretion system F family protein [Nocardioides sp. LS1]|uniref:type II secretion system F family protein n=1 Tax=Nocardioides sp. LS1 TaxID=1027620 RepID=UPI000F621027|nr:type II secretion system F family protein [Nocardioides sp. LS1]GCD89812.1 hypothetical protein NLS1_18180 [Nocardioides sp. LS1]